MIDIKILREDIEQIKKGIQAKNVQVDVDEIVRLDKDYRELSSRLDDLRSQKNSLNDQISLLLKEKKSPQSVIADMKGVSAQISDLEPQAKEKFEIIKEQLLKIPNLPHESVPVGGEDQNKIKETWGEKPKFDFKPKTHVEIAESLDIIDFQRATKLSGSGFTLYKNEGARLERALINFMLDLHIGKHGYSEMFPPFLVNTASMTGTGQLPKMADDMYKDHEEDLYLIPTAEVPVTNIHRDEILKTDELPLKYTAYTACFRREAGSYGKDTKGLMRVHQFNKVELVKFVRPENSYDELESLLNDAEKVLQLLKLPYRVLTLASGDLSFAAAKCYDIEVYASGVDKWLEASSCSNFEDFQARRANIRFKGGDTKKPTFLHTLNGSGLATPRTMIAILENYQTAEGDILIPDVLKPYMGGLEKITKK